MKLEMFKNHFDGKHLLLAQSIKLKNEYLIEKNHDQDFNSNQSIRMFFPEFDLQLPTSNLMCRPVFC